MSQNVYRVNITCPRCQFVGSVEESFPCSCSERADALEAALKQAVEALESLLSAASVAAEMRAEDAARAAIEISNQALRGKT